MEVRRSDSWIWKSLLHLRPLAERFIKASVGDGKDIRFWFDSWSPLGPLIKLLGDTGPRDLYLPRNAKVAQVCTTRNWRLPNPRSEQALELHTHLTTIPLPSLSTDQDSYHWSVNGVTMQRYSSAKT